MLQIDVLLLLLTLATIICSIVATRPKYFCDPPRHVLICAAHSDDCVIMGAEYAYGVILTGLSVKIAYLTCSGPHPDAEISRTRRAEALAAWSAIGVPKENLTFINLTESPVRGPRTYADQDIARAKEIFKTLILSLPERAAVIIPANGKSHVDHRTVRKLSLEAVVDCKRDDLLVYESPEYNGFLSLTRCPKKTIRAVVRQAPPLNRLIRPYAGPATYVSGPPGLVFRDTPNRLGKKRELLTYFPSQGDRLVQSFGYETPYRKVSLAERIQEEPNRILCVPAFGGCCGPSALALGFALLGVTFLTAHEVARGLTTMLSPALTQHMYLPLLGGLVGCVYVVRRFHGTANLETSLFVWAAALGLIFGAL